MAVLVYFWIGVYKLVKETTPVKETGTIRVTIEPIINNTDNLFNLKVKVGDKDMGIIPYPKEREKNFTGIPEGESPISIFIDSKQIETKAITVKKNDMADIGFDIPVLSLLLENANKCLRENRLTTSRSGKTAKEYFDLALKIDPENKDAKNGNRKIADRYLQIALNRNDKMKWIERGLQVYPEHEELMKLKEEIAREATPTPSPTPVSLPSPTPTPTPIVSASPSPSPTSLPLLAVQKDTPIIYGIEKEFMPVMIKLNDFWVGKFEVTFREYNYFRVKTGENKWSVVLLEKFGSRYKAKYVEEKNLKDDMPVTSVTINDAKNYAKWLSKVTGKKYRLPFEKEWEYAACGGKKNCTYFWNEDESPCEYANIADLEALKFHPAIDSEYQIVNCDDGYPYVSPSGSFKPNSFGLFDTIGNVCEWTFNEKSWLPILKGGSFLNSGQLIQIPNGIKLQPPEATYVGFRIVRDN